MKIAVEDVVDVELVLDTFSHLLDIVVREAVAPLEEGLVASGRMRLRQ